jgi:hypothetical protein
MWISMVNPGLAGFGQEAVGRAAVDRGRPAHRTSDIRDRTGRHRMDMREWIGFGLMLIAVVAIDLAILG